MDLKVASLLNDKHFWLLVDIIRNVKLQFNYNSQWYFVWVNARSFNLPTIDMLNVKMLNLIQAYGVPSWGSVDLIKAKQINVYKRKTK